MRTIVHLSDLHFGRLDPGVVAPLLAAVNATAPDLGRRLPPIQESWNVFGEIAPYWRRKYGFGPAKLIPWSGDNPSSLIGLGLIDEGDLGISLGTSDTVFAPTPNAAPDPRGSEPCPSRPRARA